MMTGPVDTGMTKAAKDQHYLLDEVETRLTELEYDEAYELKKSRLGICCLLTSVAGEWSED